MNEVRNNNTATLAHYNLSLLLHFQTSIAIGPLVLYISSVIMTIFVKILNKKLGVKVATSLKRLHESKLLSLLLQGIYCKLFRKGHTSMWCCLVVLSRHSYYSTLNQAIVSNFRIQRGYAYNVIKGAQVLPARLQCYYVNCWTDTHVSLSFPFE